VLQIAGIDSDADVGSFTLSRLRARGKFQSQLAALAPRLGMRRPEHIRVLLVHHSWEHTGRTLALHSATRGALAQWLVNHGIAVVLTGHIHTPYVGPFQPQASQSHEVLECRCGTTTQADQVPYSWHTRWGIFPQRSWPPNLLLVHRLIAQGGTTFWEVETFVRSQVNGFLSAGSGGRASLAV
jgi:hypothetical protein